MGRRPYFFQRVVVTAILAICVLVSVVSAIGYVRSFWAVDAPHYEHVFAHFVRPLDPRYDDGISVQELQSAHGTIAYYSERLLYHRSARSTAEGDNYWWRWYSPSLGTQRREGRWGFAYRHTTQGISERGHVVGERSVTFVSVPYWVALIVSIGLAWLSLRRLRDLRKLSRRASGLCGECGYDIRASSGRCSECGAAIVRVGRAGVFE